MNIRIKNRLLEIQPYQPGKPIDEVKRELGLKRVIKLASNENPFGPSPHVLEAIKKEAKSINRYPDSGCFYLRGALSKRLKVKPQQLIFGNGSDEIIVFAIRVFVEPGDEVIIAKPSFLIYEIASKIAGARLIVIPLKNFYYDLEGMLNAVNARTKMIFIGNPDNPAGTYITHKRLTTFLQRVPDHVAVFIDEAYFEYVSEKDYPNSVKLLDQFKNLIVSRTFSKMYGLAGLRVGYAVGDERVIDGLNRVREPFNVNSLAQVAAVACLKDGAYYKKIAKVYREQRQFLYKEIAKLNLKWVNSSTNFILIDVNTDSSDIACKLLKKGVIVRDMRFWGLNSFIRVTIGTEGENKIFIKSLKEIL